jgi:hypothetical protein
LEGRWHYGQQPSSWRRRHRADERLEKWGNEGRHEVVQKFFLSPEKGAFTSIFLASDPSVSDVTGAYFARGRQRPHNQVADDVAIQRHLWAESVAFLGQAGVTVPYSSVLR